MEYINKLKVEIIESLQDINEPEVLEAISEKVRHSYFTEKQIKETIQNNDGFYIYNDDEILIYRTINFDLVKKEYGGRYFELSALINIYDPVKLLYEIGAPIDEYTAEITAIIVQLKKNMKPIDIYLVLFEVFYSYFSIVVKDGEYRLKLCAMAIFNWLKHQEDWKEFPMEYFISSK